MIDFDVWWALYDYKIGKVGSMKLWKKISIEQKRLIMQHTPDYVKSTTKESFTEGEFKPKRKHPKTYLYNKAWDDEIVQSDLQEKHKLDDFETDGGGHNKIGFCKKCNNLDFYSPYEVLSTDSRCCGVKVSPKKTKIKSISEKQ